MSSEKLVWTSELKDSLLRFWQAGMSHTEIADRLGIKLEQVKNALQRARRGEWGSEYAKAYTGPRSSSSLDESVAEADARGISYGQLQVDRRLTEAQNEGRSAEPADAAHDDDPVDLQILEPVDMLEAINDLAMCSITQNSRITAVSAVEGQFADIAFVRGGIAYILSLRREDME